jgi:hypothetical protein
MSAKRLTIPSKSIKLSATDLFLKISNDGLNGLV